MMDTYSLLREIADSWVLLAMFMFFLGVAVWAYLPSQAEARADAQMIPFRDEEDIKDNEVSSTSSADGVCNSFDFEPKGQSHG